MRQLLGDWFRASFGFYINGIPHMCWRSDAESGVVSFLLLQSSMLGLLSQYVRFCCNLDEPVIREPLFRF